MKQRVLIINDDLGVRKAIGKVLQGAGYEVITAADSNEATAHLVPEQIDLVLLDLNLPGPSGWEVYERLTAQFPLVPVIIITGMPDQYRTAIAAGVGILMEKPIEAPALLKAMEELSAEPAEARLRRLCGHQADTKHFQSANSVPASHLPPIATRHRPASQGTANSPFVQMRKE